MRKKSILYADIAWEVLLDEQLLLPKATLEQELAGKILTIPNGGICLSPEIAEGLERIWIDHLTGSVASREQRLVQLGRVSAETQKLNVDIPPPR